MFCTTNTYAHLADIVEWIAPQRRFALFDAPAVLDVNPLMSSVIKLLQKEGYCPGLDSELIASALCSMLEYTGYNWTARAGDFPDRLIDDGAAIEVLTRLVLNGVRGGPAETTAASPADKEPGRDPVRRRAKSERS